jgi:hypothetical protein
MGEEQDINEEGLNGQEIGNILLDGDRDMRIIDNLHLSAGE